MTIIDALDSSRVADRLGHARWFGGKGREFTVGAITSIGELGSPGDPVHVVVALVEVVYDSGEVELYQLPLSLHSSRVERLDHAFVGDWTTDGEPLAAYDAVHDRDAMALFLRAFVDGVEGPLTFHRLPGHDLDPEAQGSLFSGEQSNSSVFFGEDAVLKLFRKLTPGENPDVTTHRVLTEAESTHVAHLYGWIDAGDLQLGMLQQFLRTASDGWDIALASIRDLFAEADLHAEEVGGDFASEAARLGEALAEIHSQLQGAFPSGVTSAASVARLMAERFDAAVDVVPDLAEHADGVRLAFTRLGALGDLPTQRVHGDLHLGQTLRTVLGWKVVDFEGEPAKALTERLLPDSVWRDVAGMTRSFDYAPHAVAASQEEEDADIMHQRGVRAHEWARRNRKAFLRAYTGRESLTDTERTILTAYVLDKAIYECVYEARNRPAWLPIPLAGVARLVAHQAEEIA